MTAQEEQICIIQSIAGDTVAFGRLVQAHQDRAVILAFNILLNQEDAEEVAQDAFVKVYAVLPAFKGQARFATWLYRIVVNKALNKKKLKRPYTTGPGDAASEELIADTASAADVQQAKEQRKQIQLALKQLSVNERLCITLYYLHELSVEEVSSITQLSLSNIKVLLHRGRKNLYKALEQHLQTEIRQLL